MNLLQKTLIAVLLLPVLSGCKKNSDRTPYETHLSVSNFVLNADSLGIVFDGVSLTGLRALAFGATGIRDSVMYLLPPAGLHSMQLLVNGKTVQDKTFQALPSQYYTLLVYDSLKGNAVPALLLQDVIKPIDTLAQLRFINTIPGSDSLSLLVARDTSVTLKDVYVGKKSSPDYPFSHAFRSGNWSVKLLRGTTILAQADSFPLRRGKLYTVFAKGIAGGTGVRAPALSVLRNN